MRLNVKLRDGFLNDTVIATVNGKEVFQKAGVQTDLSLSFADGFEIEVEDPEVELGVAVAGGPRATRKVRLAETPFVEVSKNAGDLEIRASAEEVPMM
ncbi:MAG: hypothetical protein ABJC13_07475 [Acidobacteriota bacterium]